MSASKENKRSRDEDDEESEPEEPEQKKPRSIARSDFVCEKPFVLKGTSASLGGTPKEFKFTITRFSYQTLCSTSNHIITVTVFNPKTGTKTYTKNQFMKMLKFECDALSLDTLTIDDMELSWRSYSNTLKTDRLSQRLIKKFSDPNYIFCDKCEDDECFKCEDRDPDHNYHPKSSSYHDADDYNSDKGRFYNHVIKIVLNFMDLKSSESIGVVVVVVDDE